MIYFPILIAVAAAFVSPVASHLFDSCGGYFPQGHLYRVRADENNISHDELFVISAYSGFLARNSAKLAIVTKESDLPWLESMNSGNFTDLTSLDDVLRNLPMKGRYALCNLKDNSTSAAVSYAAVHDDVLPATSAVESVLKAHGLELAIDLRDQGYNARWALDNVDNAKFSSTVSVLQNPDSLGRGLLAGMTIKCRALTWWGTGECPHNTTMDSLARDALGLLKPGGDSVVIGWGGGDDPEWGCVHAATVQGATGVIASDQAYNLAVYSSASPTLNEAAMARIETEKRKAGQQMRTEYALSKKEDSPKHTVSFIMSDGDNVQWILNGWQAAKGSNGWWASQDRGKVPLGWTLSSSLAKLAPSALALIHAQASVNDEIIAGPSGAAYAYINDYLQESNPNVGDLSPGEVAAESVANETAFLMGQCKQRIINVLADEGYTSMAGGKWLSPVLAHDNVDGVLLYEFNGYSKL